MPQFSFFQRPSLPRRRHLGAWLGILAVVSAGSNPVTAEPTPTAASPTNAPHWSFQPLQRPAPPAASPALPGSTGVSSNPIDAFIRAKLAENQLQPGPEAPRATLLRRLYLVMLGVPPTPEELAAFVGDREPRAFERWVDRVLDDPRYGERWGRHWLDVIRFAETNGFETNRERPNAWRFRDYVIAAFNEDKPYDRFIREQIAGDALGVPVATGFLVAGPVDIVGSPDIVLTSQQRADELDDMVATTGTAFLGLTLGCVRCHSHKFDPIQQSEYYGMTAIFGGVKHGDRALPLSPERQARVAELDRQITDLEQKLAPYREPEVRADVAASRPSGRLRPAVNFARNEEILPPTPARRVRFTILAASGEPCLDELEVWAGGTNVALASYGTKASASGTLPGFEIHKIEHLNDGQTGNDHSWISSESGKGWVQLDFPRSERIDRIVWGRDRNGQFKDRLATRYRIESSNDADAWTVLATSDDREPFAGAAPSKPTEPVYRFDAAPAAEAEQARRWLAEWQDLRKQRAEAAKPDSIYAGNFNPPAPTYRLHRGDPMQKRELIAPGTLNVFRPLTLSTNAPEQERRVQLADWIADPANPLPPRVIVNRLWQYHFGVGFVSTPNDFGRNGARPSHPELLDWLASELVSHGWSLKHLQRLILTSATWRQSSEPNPMALRVDAGSRLLWRFPPRRLEAEAIRDGILAVSGALDPSKGGPSFFLHDVDRENVYHYHPKEKFGPAESRRMVYALKVRMEQDGIFGSFDCPDGSLVMPKRSVSTTPLQALNLFNSRFLLDQSQHMAERLEKDAGGDRKAQVRRAWQLAFNRSPEPEETAQAAAFADTEGLPALCRAVLNANEFLFIP